MRVNVHVLVFWGEDCVGVPVSDERFLYEAGIFVARSSVLARERHVGPQPAVPFPLTVDNDAQSVLVNEGVSVTPRLQEMPAKRRVRRRESSGVSSHG